MVLGGIICFVVQANHLLMLLAQLQQPWRCELGPTGHCNWPVLNCPLFLIFNCIGRKPSCSGWRRRVAGPLRTITCAIPEDRFRVCSSGLQNVSTALRLHTLYPVYTIRQTSSKHPANAFKIHVHDVCSDCSMFAWCLLRVGFALCMIHICLTFARCLLDVCLMIDRLNGLLLTTFVRWQMSRSSSARLHHWLTAAHSTVFNLFRRNRVL